MKILFTTIFLLLFPGLALAAGGGDAHGHASLADLKWFWFNFIIYCAAIGVIIYLNRKGILGLWAQRRESIEANVNQGKNELLQAQTVFDEITARLDNLEQEKKQIQQAIISETEHEVQEMIKLAHDKAENIVERAQTTVAAERKATEQIVKEELAEYVMKQAYSKLKSELSQASDRPLRDSALNKVNVLTAN